MGTVPIRPLLKDNDGNICPNDDRTVTFTTRPGTRLVALCNGDAASREDFRSTSMKTFHGLLLAVIEGPSDGLACAIALGTRASDVESRFAQAWNVRRGEAFRGRPRSCALQRPGANARFQVMGK